LLPLNSVEQDRISTYAAYYDRMRRRNLRVPPGASLKPKTAIKRSVLPRDCAPVISNGQIIPLERAGAFAVLHVTIVGI
jgi:hypothetical protein